MNYVDVYGFGSYFRGNVQFSDIDIAIICNDRTIESCAMAISCKRMIRQFNGKCHVTMLSQQAEKSFNFLVKANAIHIERIEGVVDEASITRIMQKIANDKARPAEQSNRRNGKSAKTVLTNYGNRPI